MDGLFSFWLNIYHSWYLPWRQKEALFLTWKRASEKAARIVSLMHAMERLFRQPRHWHMHGLLCKAVATHTSSNGNSCQMWDRLSKGGKDVDMTDIWSSVDTRQGGRDERLGAANRFTLYTAPVWFHIHKAKFNDCHCRNEACSLVQKKTYKFHALAPGAPTPAAQLRRPVRPFVGSHS